MMISLVHKISFCFLQDGETLNPHAFVWRRSVQGLSLLRRLLENISDLKKRQQAGVELIFMSVRKAAERAGVDLQGCCMIKRSQT
jgi:hypothetical protein